MERVVGNINVERSILGIVIGMMIVIGCLYGGVINVFLFFEV